MGTSVLVMFTRFVKLALEFVRSRLRGRVVPPPAWHPLHSGPKTWSCIDWRFGSTPATSNVATKSPPAAPLPDGNVPANSPSSALPARSRMLVPPVPESVIRYRSGTEAMPARLMTAVL